MLEFAIGVLTQGERIDGFLKGHIIARPIV